jgi:hypothetical protein
MEKKKERKKERRKEGKKVRKKERLSKYKVVIFSIKLQGSSGSEDEQQ